MKNKLLLLSMMYVLAYKYIKLTHIDTAYILKTLKQKGITREELRIIKDIFRRYLK